MNRWHFAFRIAHLAVRVEGDVGACRTALRNLTALFAPLRNSTEPKLIFRLEQQPNGSICLFRDEALLWQSSDAGEAVAALEWHLYGESVRLLAPRLVSLHAAAISRGPESSEALLIAGHSGAGKSSLTTCALLDGCRYLSDEFSLLDEKGYIHPFPRPLQWDRNRHPAFRHDQLTAGALFRKRRYRFPDAKGDIRISLLWLPANVAHDALPASAIILPRFDNTLPNPTLEEVPRSQALMELAHQSHRNIPLRDEIRELHRRLPGDIPCYRLSFGDVHAAWRILQERGLVPSRSRSSSPIG